MSKNMLEGLAEETMNNQMPEPKENLRYDRARFAELVSRSQGRKTTQEFAESIGMSVEVVKSYRKTTYSNNRPTANTLRRIADVSEGRVTYEQLLVACGYLSASYIGEDKPRAVDSEEPEYDEAVDGIDSSEEYDPDESQEDEVIETIEENNEEDIEKETEDSFVFEESTDTVEVVEEVINEEKKNTFINKEELEIMDKQKVLRIVEEVVAMSSENHPQSLKREEVSLDAMIATMGGAVGRDYCLTSAFQQLATAKASGNEDDAIKKALWYLLKLAEMED